MLIEITRDGARALVTPITITEKPVTSGWLGNSTAQTLISFSYDSFLGAISDHDGKETKEFPISYDDFLAYAQICAADPKNPLGIINLQDDMIKRIPTLLRSYKNKGLETGARGQFPG